TAFSSILTECFSFAQRKIRLNHINKLLKWECWIEHYKDKKSGKRILSEQKTIEFPHEFVTAKALTQVGFHVLFAPKGLFKPSEKTFDVFLVKEYIILKADLKSISRKNPDTIANRIKKGGEQAPRVVVDIVSDIGRKVLIDGLRSGVCRNKNLKEILLFYRRQFYVLPKSLVESDSIYKIIK
ncbi:MAG: hypothetical protein JST39_25165, partial [Bacteroidetes bacterium]|nr:hypothetical protein [Bacteroidota bacterium]